MLEGVRVALDASPAQDRAMTSHAGAARFAFSAGLSHVKSQLDAPEDARTAGVSDESLPTVDWTLYELRRWWNFAKNEVAPWCERTFTCGACGASIDRDLNAAIDIHNFGAGVARRRKTVAEPRRRPAPAGSRQ